MAAPKSKIKQRSLDNLIPYQKGQSGNPSGRPKGLRNRSTTLRKWLEVNSETKNPLTGERERLSVEDEVVFALIKEAKDGNVNAIKEILDSVYGKTVDKVEQKIDATVVRTILPEEE